MMEIANLLPPQTFDPDPVLEFETALEQAARAIDLEPWVLQRLKHAEREITVNVPLMRDDGTAVNITGYRIQHSRAHGPSMGPVTLSPTAHPASLRTTATGITLQSALLGLRLGGAAAAIVVDPEQFTERELRHLTKDFVVALHENTGPLRDVLACEGNDYVATWMEEANTRARGSSEPAAIVGKPTDGAGLTRAWSGTMRALLQHALGADDLHNARIALQGFGRHGRALAAALYAAGARLVAIADRSGGLQRDSGIDFPALEDYAGQNGVLFGFSAADAASNSEVLESPCDVLILAAAARQVGPHNADRVRARILLELTADAVTQAAEERLPETCAVIPHILAASAQLALWSHEWQRGLSYSAPDPAHAETEATALVLDAFDRARRMSSEREIPLRQASLMLALSRLASTLRMR